MNHTQTFPFNSVSPHSRGKEEKRFYCHHRNIEVSVSEKKKSNMKRKLPYMIVKLNSNSNKFFYALSLEIGYIKNIEMTRFISGESKI